MHTVKNLPSNRLPKEVEGAEALNLLQLTAPQAGGPHRLQALPKSDLPI
jgi:hypothetical protein